MDGVGNVIRVGERDAAAFDSHARDYSAVFVFYSPLRVGLGLYQNLHTYLQVWRFWYIRPMETAMERVLQLAQKQSVIRGKHLDGLGASSLLFPEIIQASSAAPVSPER